MLETAVESWKNNSDKNLPNSSLNVNKKKKKKSYSVILVTLSVLNLKLTCLEIHPIKPILHKISRCLRELIEDFLTVVYILRY